MSSLNAAWTPKVPPLGGYYWWRWREHAVPDVVYLWGEDDGEWVWRSAAHGITYGESGEGARGWWWPLPLTMPSLTEAMASATRRFTCTQCGSHRWEQDAEETEMCGDCAYPIVWAQQGYPDTEPNSPTLFLERGYNCYQTRGWHGRRGEDGKCVDCGRRMPPLAPCVPNSEDGQRNLQTGR